MARPPKPCYKSDRKAWYATIKGKRIKLDSEKEAAFRQFHAILARKPVITGTTGMLIVLMDKFLDWIEKRRSSGTYRFYHEHCTEFHAWLKEHKLHRIDALDLKPFQVEEYLEHVTVGRRAGACQTIKRVYSWARKKGYLDRDPVQGVDNPKAGRRNNLVKRRVFHTMLTLATDQKFNDPFWYSVGKPLAGPRRHGG